MRFNSYIFLFGFLPLTLVGYQLAAHWHRRAVVIWLVVASLAFYAYWRPAYLIVLCVSVLFNYLAGALISGRITSFAPPRFVLTAAISIDLLALCYYKYLFPLLNFAALTTHHGHHWNSVVLPLGISFFTFTQIAYLVDLQQGEAVQQDFASYTLFATFFPHLIAGPILHHAEVMPQFQEERDYKLRLDNLVVGFCWFVMGLGKKILLADVFAKTADPAFLATQNIGLRGAWVGILSYSLQLYFDFSGYSDMAIGLARMFSIDFPLNFSSPYKATSIIDFWQRWHMTLTRYINSYLYNPLALWVSRRRAARGKKTSRKAMATPAGFLSMIAVPTTISLLIAGVWHGAGLQFVVFGLLHALYLTVNHAWRVFRAGRPMVFFAKNRTVNALGHAGRVLMTFSAVLVAQIFFRADGTRSALQMLAGVIGLHGANPFMALQHPGMATVLSLVGGFGIVWLLPNTQEIFSHYWHSLETSVPAPQPGWMAVVWRPGIAWGTALGLMLFVALVKMEDPTSFLYFQF